MQWAEKLILDCVPPPPNGVMTHNGASGNNHFEEINTINKFSLIMGHAVTRLEIIRILTQFSVLYIFHKIQRSRALTDSYV